MTWRIKSWEEFQHFRDRTPPWIKLHRGILDDIEWHRLEPAAAKCLVMLWLLASEDKEKNGDLPAIPEIAFRLRMSEQDVIACGDKLSHWLERGDDTVISSRHHDDNVLPHPARSQETEAEAEEETEKRSPNGDSINSRFEAFWQIVPRKIGKKATKAVYQATIKRGEATPDELEAGMLAYAAYCEAERTETRFMIHPERWIKKGRWKDDHTVRRKPSIHDVNRMIGEAMEHGDGSGSKSAGDRALEPDRQADDGCGGESAGICPHDGALRGSPESLSGVGPPGGDAAGDGGVEVRDLAGAGGDLQLCQRSPVGDAAGGAAREIAAAEGAEPGALRENGAQAAPSQPPLEPGSVAEAERCGGANVLRDGPDTRPRDITPGGVDLTPPDSLEHRAGRVKG